MPQTSENLSGIGKGRIEALGDGIFAIAMTLLILELKVPILPIDQRDQLFERLLQLWPKIAAFVVSFMICGVNWVAHHAQLHYIKRSDRTFMWLNIGYFMLISAIPFSAALLGEYPSQPVAIRVYCGNLILAGCVLFIQLRYAANWGKLFNADIAPQLIVLGGQRILIGPAIYTIAFLIAGYAPFLSVGLCAAVPVIYLFPGRVDRFWRVDHSSNRR